MTALLALASAIPLTRITTFQLVRARDLWLLLVLAAAVVWVTPREPWLGAMGVYFLLHWPVKGHAMTPHILTWAAIGVSWFALLQMPLGLFPVVWLGLAVVNVAVLLVQRRAHEPPAGLLGQRTFVGAFLALALPFAPWWLLPVFALGLALTESWVALGALVVAGGMLYPPLWVVGPLAGVLGLYAVRRGGVLRPLYKRLTVRSTTTKTITLRWAYWRLALRSLSLVGAGPGTTVLTLRRWSTSYRMPNLGGELHCDPLQHVHEYGVLGAVTLVAFAWRVAPHLAIGDPWSAAAVAGAVMAFGTFPMRVAPVGLTWLAICAGLVGR